jgi:hypothetical protein
VAKEKSKIVLSKEHFAPFIEAKKALDEKIKAEGQKAIKAFLNEFFEKRPEVYGIKWTQYTPYFNDGEPCVFRLGSVALYMTKQEFEDQEQSIWEFETYGEEPETSLNGIEDILLAVFGDHAEVSVTRDKIEVEEYSHD